jgi:hypothetical protein
MLGRLKMSVAECLRAYREMAKEAFQPKLRFLAPPGGKFSATKLTKAVKKIVKERTGDSETVFADKQCVKTYLPFSCALHVRSAH